MKAKYKLALKVPDDYGNELLIKESVANSMRLKVAIKLRTEDKPRQIADVDMERGLILMHRDASKHYHFAAKGYGFNWKVINDTSGWNTMLLSIRTSDGDMEQYEIPRRVLLDNGKLLNFKQQGFELQKFVTYDVIKEYRKNTFINPVIVK